MPTHVLAAGLALALAAAGAAEAQPTMSPGEREYMESCASCHGASGEGDGPLAELMTVEVPDLTQIAKNNDGVFPVQDIFMIIDGRSGIRGHGYPMPVWGRRYEAEAVETYGLFGAEAVVRGRILELTYHLQSIQE